MRILIIILVGLFVNTAYAADFSLQSSAFSQNQKIPVIYTCDGKNISPELTWMNPPENTRSFVIISSTPDSPVGIFYNWVLFNIPSTMNQLPEAISEDIPDPILVGHNSYDENNYRGPCPYDGNSYHYVFTIYALDAILDLPANTTVDKILNEMKHHILMKAELVGVYNH